MLVFWSYPLVGFVIMIVSWTILVGSIIDVCLKVSKDYTFSGSCMVSYLIASINLMIRLELLLIS